MALGWIGRCSFAAQSQKWADPKQYETQSHARTMGSRGRPSKVSDENPGRSNQQQDWARGRQACGDLETYSEPLA